ncbi:MAG TPA: xanthine dehydrogenase family protein subunit M [Acidimicrobiales bacterium]|nr:xanthine dehydrogenase family protein subunit M [Acidimicrobiales bacterium]
MDFYSPSSWAEALALKAAHPDAVPINGGTDVMVELNFNRRRPPALIDLSRVAGLAQWERVDGHLRVGAGVTYSRLISELGSLLPGLAIASRTVGSPQIRNRGTVGGNLGSASPAGDAHPPLLAGRARVVLESVRGRREVAVKDFFTGPKRSTLEPDELISAFIVRPASGPEQFCKVGTRNAMVIAVASFAISLDPQRGRVGTGIGSAAPTPRRARAAEEFLEGELRDTSMWESPRPLGESVLVRFGELASSASAPIDDVRGTAAYRRHALAVMARRALMWAWADLMKT